MCYIRIMRRTFTLVELMVVLVVISATLLMGWTSLSGYESTSNYIQFCSQLQLIQTTIQNYHLKHGRLPTHDELRNVLYNMQMDFINPYTHNYIYMDDLTNGTLTDTGQWFYTETGRVLSNPICDWENR